MIIVQFSNMFESVFTSNKAMKAQVDEFLEARPAIDGLLRSLFTMFLISGLACEVYVNYGPVCPDPFDFM